MSIPPHTKAPRTPLQWLRSVIARSARGAVGEALPEGDDDSLGVVSVDLRAHAERMARTMLGLSYDEALAKLDRGELLGTRAETELVMLREMLGAQSSDVERRSRATPAHAHHP